MRLKLTILYAAAILWLGGCGVESPMLKAKNVGANYRVPENAMLYALPRGYVHMTIERKVRTNTPTVPKDASKVQKDASKVQKDSSAESFVLEVTLSDPIFAPDENHIYLLEYLVDTASSDKVAIEIDGQGLLKNVTTTATDPLPAAVRELSNFIVGVATSGITPSTGLQPPAAAVPDPKPPKPFKVVTIFDPGREAGADSKSLLGIKAFLKKHGVTLDVERPLEKTPFKQSHDEIQEGCRHMVCYRYALPYRIVVEDPLGSSERAEAVVVLPNDGPVAGIEVVRRSLVENRFTLTFANGVLTKAEYNDPSAITSGLMIPIDALKAIVSIPSALFNFTVTSQTDTAEFNTQKELVNAEKQLVGTQVELAMEQLKLLQAEQALEAAQKQ